MGEFKAKWGILVVAGIATCCLAAAASAASIGVGDVAVLGINTDAPDEFAWVPLINLDPGDQLFFTDAGWNAGGSAFSTVIESALLFTTPAGGIAAGTVQLVPGLPAAVPANYVAQGGAQFNGNNMLLSSLGDQLAIFTGSAAAPTFIFAVTSHASEWGLVGTKPETTSDLYTGLMDAVNAVAHGFGPVDVEFDNIFYTGTTSGDKATLLAAISNDANWAGSNDPLADITNGTNSGGGFSVLGAGGSVVPLPASAWMGLSLLCALFLLGRVRSRLIA